MAQKSNPATRDQSVTEPTAIQAPSAFQQMIRAMEMDATADTEQTGFTGDDLIPLLTADTDEDIWEADERGPINFQHLAGCDIKVTRITVKFSRKGSDIETPFVFRGEDRQGHPIIKKMYLMVNLTRLTDSQDNKILNLPAPGEPIQANTSARFVVGKLWAFYTKGRIDPDRGAFLECRVRATDLGDGQAVLKLRPLSQKPATAETV